MSYSIVDNAAYWKIMGNTTIYKELFKSFAGYWDTNGWVFNKNIVSKENFDIMISKTNTVTPLIFCENDLYYIIKGNTTPYKEAIKAAGGKWMNSFWGFKKKNTEEQTFTKEYVESVLQKLLDKNIPMNVAVKNSTEMPNKVLSDMSDNELRDELTKALEYVKKIKEIMKQRIDDE